MQPTRISARQAEAKQRISQIHDPSGAAPPFETTPAMPRQYYWRFNPGKSEEIQLLHDMLQYLHDDPHTPDTMDMLTFMLRERPQLEANIQTKTGRDKLKTRLIELGIRYLHWNQTTTDDRSYWTTYTAAGAMEAYYRTPNDAYRSDLQPPSSTVKTRDSPHSGDKTRDSPLPTAPGVEYSSTVRSRTSLSNQDTTPNTTEDPSVVYLHTTRPASSSSADSDEDTFGDHEAWLHRTRAPGEIITPRKPSPRTA